MIKAIALRQLCWRLENRAPRRSPAKTLSSGEARAYGLDFYTSVCAPSRSSPVT
jgi:hypothetical protein